MLNFILAFGLGLVTGWVLLKRPEWVSDAFAWLRSKIGW